LPRTPALHALAEDLDQAEARLDVPALVERGVESAVRERYRYAGGRVEQIEDARAESAATDRAEAQRAPAR
jgi:hypothetical protein